MLVKYNSFGLAKINAPKVVYYRHENDKTYHIDIMDVFFFLFLDNAKNTNAQNNVCLINWFEFYKVFRFPGNY